MEKVIMPSEFADITSNILVIQLQCKAPVVILVVNFIAFKSVLCAVRMFVSALKDRITGL